MQYTPNPNNLSRLTVVLLCLFLVIGGVSLQAQNPSQIYDLIVDKKIDKAIEKRNKIYEGDKKSDLLLIDLCDCMLFNMPEYKAYNPERACEIFNRSLLPNDKERTLIKFLDKKKASLDSIRVHIEENLYTIACKENSEASYAKFVKLCPQSQWATEAAKRQEETAYRDAIEKGSIEGYNYFLSHYADSEHVVEITRLTDKTIFAHLENNIEAYKEFIKLYPQSELVEEAHNRIYRLAYAQAREKHTREAYVQLLDEYPELPMRDEAQSAIESFDYLSITRQPSQYAYEKFLRDYPSSTYITPLNDWLGHVLQSESHRSHHNLNGYVRTIQESAITQRNGKESRTDINILYDQLGLILLIENTTDGKTEEKSYLYHPDFSLASISTPQGKTTYYYNDRREISRITESRNGEEKEIARVIYNDGRPAQRIDIIAGKGEQKTDYTYNDGGTLISTKSYNSNTPQNTTTTYYTPHGDVKLQITLVGRSRNEKIYFYNERNDVSKITFMSGGEKSDTTYEYLYDEQGNWTERTGISSNDTTTTRRTFEYYIYK